MSYADEDERILEQTLEVPPANISEETLDGATVDNNDTALNKDADVPELQHTMIRPDSDLPDTPTAPELEAANSAFVFNSPSDESQIPFARLSALPPQPPPGAEESVEDEPRENQETTASSETATTDSELTLANQTETDDASPERICEADLDTEELFELQEDHLVEEGRTISSPSDDPVSHQFDFGTPEMVFDSSAEPAASNLATEVEVDVDLDVYADATHENAQPEMVSFIFDSASDAAYNAVDENLDDENEEELDIGDAEELAVTDDNGPRPIDTFFKADQSRDEPSTMSEPARPRRRRGAPQEWWASIFDDEYLMLLPPQSLYEQQKQIDFIQNSLGLPPGSLLLDLACGNGLNSIGMARRNFRVVGVDLSLSMLARAGEAAQEAGQKINFIHGDMRDLGFDKTFDGVYCLDTSFGFFDEPTNLQVLNGVYRALKPGGVFLLELANRDFVIKQQPNLIWFQMDNMVCMEETDFNYINSRLYITRQLIIGDNQKQSRHEFSLRLYSLHEIGQQLHQAGFAVTKVSGHRAHSGAFFGPESSKLIIVCERRHD